MKKLYISALILVSFALFSCGRGDGRGELVGVANTTVKHELPYGMVYIPAGTFVMGQVDQDVTISQFPQNKQVTISAFYMDETEITNSEYKQFVNWVRDSIAFYQVGKPQKYVLKNKGGKASTNINWAAMNKKSGMWGDKTLKDKLEKAMLLGNGYKAKVKITFETLEGVKKIETTVWEASEDQLMIKSDVMIPIHSSLDVEL